MSPALFVPVSRPDTNKTPFVIFPGGLQERIVPFFGKGSSCRETPGFRGKRDYTVAVTLASPYGEEFVAESRDWPSL
jgi:hypothetical protein